MEVRKDLVEELCGLAANGEGPSSLAVLIGKRLGLEGGQYRLHAIAYFQAAFGLELQEAMRIGAAPAFEEGSRDAKSTRS